jgi:hypothetical protein
VDILAAIKGEERKLDKQLSNLNHQLSGMSDCKSLGHSAEREVVGAKKRVVSAAGRAAINQGGEEAVGRSGSRRRRCRRS